MSLWWILFTVWITGVIPAGAIIYNKLPDVEFDNPRAIKLLMVYMWPWVLIAALVVWIFTFINNLFVVWPDMLFTKIKKRRKDYE